MAKGEAEKLIRAERQAHTTRENWSFQHDDEHDDGALLVAAGVYLRHGTEHAAPLDKDGVPADWPWEAKWFKPKGRIRDLVRAGALCLAEDDRLNRTMTDGRPAIFFSPWVPEIRVIYDEIVAQLEVELAGAE